MSNYFPGAVVRLSATFAVAGVNTDPSVTTLKVKLPSGTVSTIAQASLAHDGAGQWHYDLAVTLPGLYWYRFEGTGAAQAAAEVSFMVNATQF